MASVEMKYGDYWKAVARVLSKITIRMVPGEVIPTCLNDPGKLYFAGKRVNGTVYGVGESKLVLTWEEIKLFPRNWPSDSRVYFYELGGVFQVVFERNRKLGGRRWRETRSFSFGN